MKKKECACTYTTEIDKSSFTMCEECGDIYLNLVYYKSIPHCRPDKTYKSIKIGNIND